MKRVTITRDKFASAKGQVEPLTPRSDLSAERHAHRIIIAIAGKRYEITLHT